MDEIQNHSKSVIEHCYQRFLIESHDSDNREYIDAKDQVREVLIHQNYFSKKDIEICLNYNNFSIAERADLESIQKLHETLKSEYGQEKIFRK